MIYKIPKEFKIPMGVYKDDNDRVEFKYEEYSKSIYEIITSKIKEIWNYEIVEDILILKNSKKEIKYGLVKKCKFLEN